MENIQLININMLRVDENQPRLTFLDDSMELLKESIKEFQIQVPLFVSILPNGYYKILDGERRYRVSCDLGLTELPCIIKGDLSNMEVLENQLMLECLKEKIPSAERDLSIYNYSKMLHALLEDEKSKLSLNYIRAKDWTVPYISKRIGLSQYIVRVAIDKEDFKARNIDFRDEIKQIISGKNSDIKEKRYNVALEETARIKLFKEKGNDDLRKRIVKFFVVQTKDKGENTTDAQTLRKSIREMVENTELKNESLAIDQLIGILLDKYFDVLNDATSKLLSSLESHNINSMPEKYIEIISNGFSSVLDFVKTKKG